MQVPAENKQGVSFRRLFCSTEHPFDTVNWVLRDAVIIGADGKEKFRQNEVEVPDWWNDSAINIVAEKYFRVVNGVKECSAKQMFQRVAGWLKEQGLKQRVFDQKNADIFEHELLYMFVHGMHAFNSPVWFNVGVTEKPQCSACFIQSVDDNMTSILDLARKEVLLFKRGSGTGSNLSPLRSSYEDLSGGGVPSGPVSFMKGYDQWAGVTKSGGGTRRAAKMVVLNVDHPDILEQKNGEPGFITCKAHAEKVAHDLYSTGMYSAEWNKPGNVYDLVGYQNANNSVRVTDMFMEAVESDGVHNTIKRTEAQTVHSYKARDVMNEIAKSAWMCGDPGIQFDTSTNEWHTCPSSGRINASNPCSEYLFLDDTACNLSSLNLLTFVDGDKFDTDKFIHASEIAITSKEIIVDASGYPSELLEQNSRKYRTLGLGYTNLGALLTFWGLPYDSDQGRQIAAAITALMCGAAYRMSAELARVQGPFPEYTKNKEHMLRVISKHKQAAKRIPTPLKKEWQVIADKAIDAWADAYEIGSKWGFRNAQVVVIAPTGTISFLMNASTTGAEPSLGVVTYKKTVGEGLMVIPNAVVEPALYRLGYATKRVGQIMDYIRTTGTIHSCPHLLPEHAPVFAEALGDHALSPEAHVDMLIAIQPFVSGSISKTVNLPSTATIQDIYNIYMRAWKGRLKCIAVYRDGCKLSQPIATDVTDTGKKQSKAIEWGNRKKIPATRESITHKFSIGSQEGYLISGKYPDGSLGEIFVEISKQGSTLMGMVDAWATAVSIGLQHGVPFETFKEKFCDMQFEPRGFTEDDEIRMAKSIPDYIFRWLDKEFFSEDVSVRTESSGPVTSHVVTIQGFDGPPCMKCGNLTKRAGSCYLCNSCGTTTGCS
jgi:ribonucleoside-diphosphate reductase alpha chain